MKIDRTCAHVHTRVPLGCVLFIHLLRDLDFELDFDGVLFSFDFDRRSDDFDFLSLDLDLLRLFELLRERERRSRDLDLVNDLDLNDGIKKKNII